MNLAGKVKLESYDRLPYFFPATKGKNFLRNISHCQVVVLGDCSFFEVGGAGGIFFGGEGREPCEKNGFRGGGVM